MMMVTAYTGACRDMVVIIGFSSNLVEKHAEKEIMIWKEVLNLILGGGGVSYNQVWREVGFPIIKFGGR